MEWVVPLGAQPALPRHLMFVASVTLAPFNQACAEPLLCPGALITTPSVIRFQAFCLKERPLEKFRDGVRECL